MRNVVEMCDRLLKPGGHGIIFTSVLQFCDWYKYLAEFTEYESEGEESQPMAEPVPTVFNVEEVPLVCIRAPGHYFAYPGRKSCSHMSVMEVAIHSEPSQGVDECHRRDPPYACFGAGEGDLGRQEKFLRPEQKNVALIR